MIPSDLAKAAARCITCTLAKTPVDLKCGPCKVVYLDLLGPWPTSEDGHRYVLVAMDAFLRFLELTPIPDKTARTVLEAFVGGRSNHMAHRPRSAPTWAVSSRQPSLVPRAVSSGWSLRTLSPPSTTPCPLSVLIAWFMP